MEKCGRCLGEGYQVWNEDGRIERDGCYRCGATGFVDEESARDLRLERVTYVLASFTIEARRAAANQNPDGENWAFCAAEEMMTERDYTQAMTMTIADRHREQIDRLSRELQDALIAALESK